jgi:serine/threonine-protein kinase
MRARVLVLLLAALVAVLAGCGSDRGGGDSGGETAGSTVSVEVPDVVGQSLDAATQALVDAGLLTGTITDEVSDQPPGTVLTQSPAAGETVTSGSPVTLTVAARSALVTVPDLVGLTGADAANALSAAGLLVGETERVGATAPAGQILAQSPAPGSTVAGGSSVDVTVSDGSATVPDLVGLNETVATNLVLAAGLTVGTVAQKTSDKAPGTVVGQEPKAGAEASPGATVDMTVAVGQPLVPDVVGKPLQKAQNTLTDAGYVVVIQPADVAGEPGTVVTQDPAGGTALEPGQEVTLIVPLEPSSSPTPSG